MNPFSDRWTARTRSIGSAGGGSPPESAHAAASWSAADDERPAPCGRSDARTRGTRAARARVAHRPGDALT